MHAAIIGGRLQGLEACYLARKAGWRTLLIDKALHPPACRVCDRFLQLDIRDWKDRLPEVQCVDVIIPAVENPPALDAVAAMGERLGIPCILDRNAYFISSSKKRSYAVLQEIGVPVPQKWPECGFPVIIKPDGESGSKHVQVHGDMSQELKSKLAGEGWVAEKYLPGTLHSIEVIGVPGDYEAIQVTDLVLDPAFDCKRVVAPSQLDSRLSGRFREQALRIAEAVGLHGIMDVEAILHEGELITIEIDARLPSQTPTAVYWSSQCNILERFQSMLFGEERGPLNTSQYHDVIYEHIHVGKGSLAFRGEGCIAKAADLRLVRGFYGADEAITNAHASPADWVATLVFAGSSAAGVQRKRAQCYNKLKDAFDIEHGLPSGVYM